MVPATLRFRRAEDRRIAQSRLTGESVRLHRNGSLTAGKTTEQRWNDAENGYHHYLTEPYWPDVCS